MYKELEEDAEKYANELPEPYNYGINPDKKKGFIQGAKWQQEELLKFINNEDNHTEGELGNSCIDVQTLLHFIKQFKKK